MRMRLTSQANWAMAFMEAIVLYCVPTSLASSRRPQTAACSQKESSAISIRYLGRKEVGTSTYETEQVFVQDLLSEWSWSDTKG